MARGRGSGPARGPQGRGSDDRGDGKERAGVARAGHDRSRALGEAVAGEQQEIRG